MKNMNLFEKHKKRVECDGFTELLLYEPEYLERGNTTETC